MIICSVSEFNFTFWINERTCMYILEEKKTRNAHFGGIIENPELKSCGVEHMHYKTCSGVFRSIYFIYQMVRSVCI